MIRSTIIFLLISWVQGENLQLNDFLLIELVKSFNEAENYMTREASGEDAAIVLGMVHTGKSSLINYLIGNKLKGVKLSKYDEFKIMQDENRSKGPEIGFGLTPETTIPTKWISDKLPGLSIFDFPGYSDFRESLQEITNSFYLYHLAKKVKSLKFILVINFFDIARQDVNPLLKSLQYAKKLFGNKFEMFFPSISVIFSKVPRVHDNNAVDMEMIEHYLKEKSNVPKGASNNIKSFLNYIIKNNDRIGLFRKPENNETITSDTDFEIFSAIRNSRSVQRNYLQYVLPSISDPTIVFLRTVPHFLNIEIRKIAQSLYEIFKKELVKNQDDEAIPKIQANLNYIEDLLYNSVRNETNIYENTKIIEKIGIKLKKKIDDSNLLTKVEMFTLFSDILKLNVNKILHEISRNLILILRNEVRNAKNEFLTLTATEIPELTTTITENPTENTKQSTDITEDPEDITEDPEDITEDPEDITEDPEDITENFTEDTEQSTDVIEGFEEITENVMENTKQSTVVTENSSNITEDSTDIVKNSTEIPEYLANNP
ncbi:thioredoxin domain-containing protein 2-like [Leptopilina heterotoma]|uniref:thioredoxin domain-containing protein 2-like n=1 Tax=Leptopilina heterotoma TaxID=63436 RepID=UPI001CA9FA2E|nr:thioredoxin domain-containing protein 2-like [Leptopilina heterotoma]